MLRTSITNSSPTRSPRQSPNKPANKPANKHLIMRFNMSALHCLVLMAALVFAQARERCTKASYGKTTQHLLELNVLHVDAKAFTVTLPIEDIPCEVVGSYVEVCVKDSRPPHVYMQSLGRAQVVRQGQLYGVATVYSGVYCRRPYYGQSSLPAPKVVAEKDN